MTHVSCLTNPISQPSFNNSPIFIPPVSNEISNSQILLAFLKDFHPKGSVDSTDGASGWQNIVSQISAINPIHCFS
jgi:hypothetical protein